MQIDSYECWPLKRTVTMNDIFPTLSTGSIFYRVSGNVPKKPVFDSGIGMVNSSAVHTHTVFNLD